MQVPMTLYFSYRQNASPSTTLSLDTILSAAYHAMVTQAVHLESNKAFTVFRYLLYRLYDQGRGNLINAELTFAQTSLALKLGISRQWVGELSSRLQAEGWIEYHSPQLFDGTNGSTIWRAGRMLKRLLVMLAKSGQRKRPTKSDDKCSWRFSPLSKEREVLKIRAKENEPPKPHMLARFPLLKEWLTRGQRT
jgi:hypothetical protein